MESIDRLYGKSILEPHFTPHQEKRPTKVRENKRESKGTERQNAKEWTKSMRKCDRIKSGLANSKFMQKNFDFFLFCSLSVQRQQRHLPRRAKSTEACVPEENLKGFTCCVLSRTTQFSFGPLCMCLLFVVTTMLRLYLVGAEHS